MNLSDHDLAIMGLWASIIPALVIVYFDWRRRLSEKYTHARDWVFTCLTNTWGIINISLDLYRVLDEQAKGNLEKLDSIKINGLKKSHVYMINKAQDLFLSREPLCPFRGKWDGLSKKYIHLLESLSPFVYSETDLLNIHLILQVFQDNGELTGESLAKRKATHSSTAQSLQSAVSAVELLNIEIARKFPIPLLHA